MTGGAGFIGSHLVHRIVESGASVRVFDDLSTGHLESLADVRDRIDFVEGSVTDLAACEEVCRDVDYVLHQAALPSVKRSVADPLETHRVAATGTLNMLVAARSAGVKRFVYAASSSAYGDSPALPKREEMPTNPLSPYAVAKLAGERYAGVFWHVHGLETVSLRYFNVFGPRQDPDSPYSAVIPIFVRRALEGRAPTIDGDGGQTRDFTFVSNVVDANLAACEAPAERVAGEVFNVGNGERTSVNEVWRIIRDVTGTSAEAEYGPPRPGDVRDSLASVEKARRAFGYEPAVTFREGLERTVDWLRKSTA